MYRTAALGALRRNTSKGMVFYNLVSNIKHISAVPFGWVHAGSPGAWWTGLHLQHTLEGQQFLDKFKEVSNRNAGELSYDELQKYMRKDPEGIFQKGWSMAERYGFLIGRQIDENNSKATFIGRYLNNLKEAGLPASLEEPVNQQAAANALVSMRRVVSSTHPKDLPPVLSRGQGFGGGIDWARTVYAFKQFALERYSQKHDIVAALKSGNYLRAAGFLGAAGLAGLYESQVAGVVHHAVNSITGQQDKKDTESWYEKLAMDQLGIIPIVGPLLSMAIYHGSSGIPLIDTIKQGASGMYGAISAKTGEAKKSNAIK